MITPRRIYPWLFSGSLFFNLTSDLTMNPLLLWSKSLKSFFRFPFGSPPYLEEYHHVLHKVDVTVVICMKNPGKENTDCWNFYHIYLKMCFSFLCVPAVSVILIDDQKHENYWVSPQSPWYNCWSTLP